jgi:hypothetical protein
VKRFAELDIVRYCSLLIAAFPAAVCAAPASEFKESHVSRASIAAFAACLAKRHRSEAADYVIRANVPFSTTLRAEKKLADRACVPATSSRGDAKAMLKLPKELRAALAEALVRQEFPVFDASQTGTARPLDYANMPENLWPNASCKKCKPEKLRESEDARAKASKLMAPLVFGECAVRTDPANSHRLLLTEVGSPEEDAALSALQPAFADCVIDGLQFSISRAAVRDIVALNYFRLARAPRVQQTAGTVN